MLGGGIDLKEKEEMKKLSPKINISGWNGIMNCGSIVEEWYSTPVGIIGVKG